MSSTPAPKYVCPRCRSSFEDPCHFCRECGADMTRASALDAARVEPTSVTDGTEAVIDRRLNDSNQAWLGKVVDGRYKVMEVIGRGGMGVVYRVEHLRMGKVAAMKVLHRDLASDPDVVQRFEREAAAVSRLHHPHTVQVFDFGTAQGALYLIMEYVRGLDLGTITTRDGPLPWSRAAPLLAQICGALAEAHELGIVHRDLKPENVLITRTGNGRDYAKVLDFGLAKLEQQQATTATDRQQIVGTPYFMSPEQIRGDDVDARSDIYSFGCLMFELLTGQHLFTGSTAVGVLTKHLTAEPDAPSMRAPKLGIDPQVDALCRKALAKDPSMRFQTATALVEAIEEVYTDTVGNATGAGSRSRNRAFAIPDQGEESDVRLRRSDIDAFERGMKRQRYVTLGLMIALVVGAAGGAAYVLTRPQPVLDEEREPNDDIAHANKIALTVTGHIGKRHSPEAGDRDTFIVPWPSTTKRVVSVRVSGLPNLDINLALTDGDGLHGAVADEGQIGEGEMLHRRSIDGSLVISIDQTLLPNQHLPVENVSDLYTVTVVEEDPSAGEVEPNGTDADANPLQLTKELRGYLDTRTDVDVLRWMGETGTFNVVVRADGIPLAWHIGDNKPRTPGAASVQLQHGDLIRIERTDKGQKGPLPGRDQPWSIAVTK